MTEQAPIIVEDTSNADLGVELKAVSETEVSLFDIVAAAVSDPGLSRQKVAVEGGQDA